MTGKEFSPDEQMLFYRIVESRRDVRAFRSDPIPEPVLLRILNAAHQAPSVGFMQPWNFIVIEDHATRAAIKAVFLREYDKAAAHYSGERATLYRSLKLEGIQEAPINLCVTCDRDRSGTPVLGRNTIIDTDLYSTCCAIQNLWLAARVENIGVGWVSILTNQDLSRILHLPDSVVPVAYLCVGYPEEFLEEPELQRRGWAPRLRLDELVFSNRWGHRLPSGAGSDASMPLP